jgi:hypothetical protein
VKITCSGEMSSEIYDAAVFSCGYESRSIAIPKRANYRSALVLGYDYNNATAVYRENVGGYKKLGLTVQRAHDAEVAGLISEYLEPLKKKGDLKVLVDITTMNRVRIALSVEMLNRTSDNFRFVYGYCFSKYVPPLSEDAYCSLASHGPVSRYFSGTTVDVDQPLAMVVGLGYEAGRAIGITEANDPSRVHLFVPHGGLGRFDKDVRIKNADLLAMQKNDSGYVHGYDVNEFDIVFEKLESLISGLVGSGYRVVIVPMGPKIFCLASLLVASVHREVSIWRASSGARESAVDRKASKKCLFAEVNPTWKPI